MKDAKIVDLYWKRSERAISESRSKYGRFCNAVAFGILHSYEDADECEADTYHRAWNAMPDKRPNKLGPFLGAISRNFALDLWRKTHAQKRGGDRVSLALDEIEECIPGNGELDKIVDSREIDRVLDEFLGSLPERERTIFVQKYWYLRSMAEIAEDLGLSVSNVGTILGRLRGQLKNNLDKEGLAL